MIGAAIEHRPSDHDAIAIFLATSSFLTAATFVATSVAVEAPPVRRFYTLLVYGWLRSLVEAARDDEQFIVAYVVTDLSDGARSLGYQGSVLDLTINADKQITAIVLEEARAFYLTMEADAVSHVAIPRETPLAQLYLDGPQIKNIAFEVYAMEWTELPPPALPEPGGLSPRGLRSWVAFGTLRSAVSPSPVRASLANFQVEDA